MIDLTNPCNKPRSESGALHAGVVARRNNFVEPILDFLEAGTTLAIDGPHYGW
jgi:hypothetical protein